MAVRSRSLAEDKRRLRAALAARVRAMGPGAAARAAEAAARHLERSEELAACRAVVLYASLPDELPSRPLFSLVRRLERVPLFPRMTADGTLEMVPCAVWEDLKPARYGVPEPPGDRAGRGLEGGDLVLLPGRAFDACGHRLGRGAGFWDRTIPAMRPRALVLVGVAFECQRIDAVPHGPHDRSVDAVLTESGLHRVRADCDA